MEGNIAWMLVSAALVLFMTPGLALFYGGMDRSRNVLNMLMMSFTALGIVCALLATRAVLGLFLIGWSVLKAHLKEAGTYRYIEEVAADKGYHKGEALQACGLLNGLGIRTYVPEPESKYERKWTDKSPLERKAVENNRRRMKRKRNRRFAFVHQSLEFFRPARPTHEVDPLVAAHVADEPRQLTRVREQGPLPVELVDAVGQRAQQLLEEAHARADFLLVPGIGECAVEHVQVLRRADGYELAIRAGQAQVVSRDLADDGAVELAGPVAQRSPETGRAELPALRDGARPGRAAVRSVRQRIRRRRALRCGPMGPRSPPRPGSRG